MARCGIAYRRHVLALTALFAAASIGAPHVRASTWEIDTLATVGSAGLRCEIVRDASGNFHVVYIRADTHQLVLLSRVGLAWDAPQVVADNANEATGCSIALENGGSTRFAFMQTGDLALLYAGPEPVHSWALGGVTNGADDVGTSLSMHRRADGVLSVSCRNQTVGSLVFTTRDEAGVWAAPTTIDPGPNRGTHSDHVYRPGVGYAFTEHDEWLVALRFADPVISAHEWALGIIRSQGDAGKNVSVATMPNGRPACVFLNYDDSGLGAVHVAYAVGTADYWSLRSVADSVATTALTNITPDIAFTPSWGGFAAFRNDTDDQLQAAVTDTVVTGIGDGPDPLQIPARNELHPGFPNPFNPSTTIPYSLATTGAVTLRVYDVRGALVATLVDGVVVAGRHRATWDGRDRHGNRVGSGVYFVRLTVGGDVRAGKIVLVK